MDYGDIIYDMLQIIKAKSYCLIKLFVSRDTFKYLLCHENVYIYKI